MKSWLWSKKPKLCPICANPIPRCTCLQELQEREWPFRPSGYSVFEQPDDGFPGLISQEEVNRAEKAQKKKKLF